MNFFLQSGKSYLLREMIEDSSIWMEPHNLVIYCAPRLTDRDGYLDSLLTICENQNKRLATYARIPPLEVLEKFTEGKRCFFTYSMFFFSCAG